MQGLEEKAGTGRKCSTLKFKADSIRDLSTGLYDFLENIKEGACLSAEDKGIPRDNYSKLDNTGYYTTLFFEGEGYKEAGQQFLDEMNKFRTGLFKLLVLTQSLPLLPKR